MGADDALETGEAPQAERWEYGFYDSNPDGDWRSEPKPQDAPTILWYVFGFLTHQTAESAQHTGSKSVWGQAVIVRRRPGSADWEHVADGSTEGNDHE